MTDPIYPRAGRTLLWLYVAQVAALFMLAGLYKASVWDWSLISTKAGTAAIAGVIGVIACAWFMLRQLQSSGPVWKRVLALALTTNLVTLLVAFLLLEATVRIAARKTEQGIVVGSVAVRPTWSELTAQSRRIVNGAAPWGTWEATYFVYDPELGWTVGRNRRSPDGLYFSSIEGIRSAAQGVRMADRAARFRVALIGDSNAFSFEVPFKDSWGYHLERFLGDNVQVLNFGVDGYGIDQMYLRYQRDVRPWKPRVVVIGFIAHDLARTMAVYPFVSFGWPGYVVKPRFAIENGELKLLNVPLPTTEQILGIARIQQLPLVQYDLGYATTDWRWRFDQGPLLLRFLTSAYPRWPLADPRVSDEASAALNGRLLALIIDSIRRDGAVPIVVFMGKTRDALVEGALSNVRIAALNATTCLSGLPAESIKVPSGHHYTGLANEAIARCTAPLVNSALGRRCALGACTRRFQSP